MRPVGIFLFSPKPLLSIIAPSIRSDFAYTLRTPKCAVERNSPFSKNPHDVLERWRWIPESGRTAPLNRTPCQGHKTKKLHQNFLIKVVSVFRFRALPGPAPRRGGRGAAPSGCIPAHRVFRVASVKDCPSASRSAYCSLTPAPAPDALLLLYPGGYSPVIQ